MQTVIVMDNKCTIRTLEEIWAAKEQDLVASLRKLRYCSNLLRLVWAEFEKKLMELSSDTTVSDSDITEFCKTYRTEHAEEFALDKTITEQISMIKDELDVRKRGDRVEQILW